MDWIYIHRTFVYCWYQCSSIIIGDSARRIRIIILTCIDTNRFESLRHPRSPLNGEIYPRHICKEDSSGSYIIHDGRLRAGYARVVTRQGVEWRKMTKNTWQYFEDEADYRLLLVSMQVSIIILILRAESPICQIPRKQPPPGIYPSKRFDGGGYDNFSNNNLPNGCVLSNPKKDH